MATEDSLAELDEWLARQRENYEAGYISAKQLNEAQVDHAAGLRGYTAQLKQSMAQLGTSAKDTAKTMLQGQESSAAFGKTVESGADAVAAYTAKFGTAGKALGLFVQGLAKLNTAGLKQSKDLFEQYQKLSQVGVVGGKAMDEVYEKMRQFGYTTDQLGNLNRVLTENSKSLGKFYGSALEGSRVMGRAAAGFAEQRESLRTMGLTVDDLNDGLAGYMAQEGAFGRLRGKTNKELTDGTIAYIKELDIMTKLTGMGRQEQQAIQEQGLQIKEFYSVLETMDPKAAKEAMDTYKMLVQKIGPEQAAGYAAQFGGVVQGNTDLFMSTGGASQKFGKEFIEKGGTAAQAIQGIADSITPAMLEVSKGQNQLGGQFGLNYRQLIELKESTKTAAADVKNAKKDQADQLAKKDSTTASQATIAEDNLKAGQATADFFKIFAPTSVKILKWATEVNELLTRLAPGASARGLFGFGVAKSSPPAAEGGAAPAAGGAAPAAPSGRSRQQRIPAPSREAMPAEPPAVPVPAAPSAGPTPAPAAQAFDMNKVKNLIASVESKGNYNIAVGGKKYPLTDMTVAQVLSLQSELKSGPGSAMGKYQVIRGTLLETIAKLGLSRDDKFDAATQEKIGEYLIRKRGYDRYARIGTTEAKEQFLTSLANEWAGLPAGPSGRSRYAGVGNNNAHIGWNEALAQLQNGGIASGPNSGYPAILHGDEAVIPLDNNSGNFVQMFETMASTNQRIVSLLEETLDVQASIASATQNTADSSSKMLHYAQG